MPTSPLHRLCVAVAITCAAVPALALDLPTLDRVGVMMSFDQVKQVAGAPDSLARIEPEFTLATWTMKDTPGMIAAGGIFDRRNALIALAYVFAGRTGTQALDSLRGFGFRVEDRPDGSVRLFGNDDDSGRPLVVVIDEQPDATTVYAYDQGEYDRRVAAGPLPTGPGTPIAAAAAQPPKPGMDPAVKAAVIGGLMMMGGAGGPGTMPGKWEKSTTLSSSSSTTRNADGSVTTRSSRTTASVSVDPAGVANALLQLMK
ncbi:MAG: hypothetical protein U1F10_04475 [Burkholderiales bacterium]